MYQRLVDLYASRDLTEDLEAALEMHADNDPVVLRDMTTLRRTVDLLQSSPSPEFTEESYQRVLLKMYARGADIAPAAPPSLHLQYPLDMQG